MSAPVTLAAAATVAASLILTTVPAAAADLYAPPRAGSPYDDPRYADVFGDGPADEGYAYDRYGEPPEDFEPADPPRRGDKGFGYEPGYAPYRRASRYGYDCVPRRIVRDRLRAEGWLDFEDLQPRGQLVLVQARRRSGQLFNLTVDRCSGEIVDVRPLRGDRFFADAPRRNWRRSY